MLEYVMSDLLFSSSVHVVHTYSTIAYSAPTLPPVLCTHRSPAVSRHHPCLAICHVKDGLKFYTCIFRKFMPRFVIIMME